MDHLKSIVKRDFYIKIWWKVKYLLLKEFNFDSSDYEDKTIWQGISQKKTDETLFSFLKHKGGENDAWKNRTKKA